MILLIDGRSGSGKSELATGLADVAQVVRLDDIYPGWDGLERASDLVPRIIAGRRYRRWDWATAAYAEWIELDPGPVVIEGCGALTRASRALADYALWVEHPAADRKRRALAREPDFEPHWLSWAAQEDEHIARENPQLLANETVDGSDVTVGLARWRGMLDPARVGE